MENATYCFFRLSPCTVDSGNPISLMASLYFIFKLVSEDEIKGIFSSFHTRVMVARNGLPSPMLPQVMLAYREMLNERRKRVVSTCFVTCIHWQNKCSRA
ncbi:hypothetical protein TNCV_788391 [Trichonephila clavipes]|nr:hypothetical protein TNCV_788391 [Trichonephila clavipes]